MTFAAASTRTEKVKKSFKLTLALLVVVLVMLGKFSRLASASPPPPAAAAASHFGFCNSFFSVSAPILAANNTAFCTFEPGERMCGKSVRVRESGVTFWRLPKFYSVFSPFLPFTSIVFDISDMCCRRFRWFAGSSRNGVCKREEEKEIGTVSPPLIALSKRKDEDEEEDWESRWEPIFYFILGTFQL